MVVVVVPSLDSSITIGGRIPRPIGVFVPLGISICVISILIVEDPGAGDAASDPSGDGDAVRDESGTPRISAIAAGEEAARRLAFWYLARDLDVGGGVLYQ